MSLIGARYKRIREITLDSVGAERSKAALNQQTIVIFYGKELAYQHLRICLFSSIFKIEIISDRTSVYLPTLSETQTISLHSRMMIYVRKLTWCNFGNNPR